VDNPVPDDAATHPVNDAASPIAMIGTGEPLARA